MKRFVLILIVSLLMLLLTNGMGYARKLKIAVAQFENKSDYPYSVSPLRDLVVEALFKTNLFDVYEREKLGVLMKEKKLSQTGVVKDNYQNSFSGVDAILYGVVTQFGKKSIKKGGLGGTLKWGILGGKKKDVVEVTINLRLIDVNTGQILAVGQATGRKKIKKGVIVGLFKGIPLGWGKLGTDNTLIGQAIKEAVNNAVKFVVKVFKRKNQVQLEKDKFLAKYREKYPQIFGMKEKNDDKTDVAERENFSSKSIPSNRIKLYLNLKDKDSPYHVSQIVENVLLNKLKQAGYSFSDSPNKAVLSLEGTVSAQPLTNILTPSSPDDSFKSVTAKINLKIKKGDNILNSFFYQLPKPQLHLRGELAADNAAQKLALLVSQKVIAFLNQNREMIEKNIEKKKKDETISSGGIFLKIKNITDFSQLSKIKNFLVEKNISYVFKGADFSSKGAQFKIFYRGDIFKLADQLAKLGWKIEKFSTSELIITK